MRSLCLAISFNGYTLAEVSDACDQNPQPTLKVRIMEPAFDPPSLGLAPFLSMLTGERFCLDCRQLMSSTLPPYRVRCDGCAPHLRTFKARA